MEEIDYVFHLAALIGIPYSYYSPLAYIKTNIEGTYNILQAARALNTQKLLSVQLLKFMELLNTCLSMKSTLLTLSHPMQQQRLVPMYWQTAFLFFQSSYCYNTVF